MRCMVARYSSGATFADSADGNSEEKRLFKPNLAIMALVRTVMTDLLTAAHSVAATVVTTTTVIASNVAAVETMQNDQICIPTRQQMNNKTTRH